MRRLTTCKQRPRRFIHAAPGQRLQPGRQDGFLRAPAVWTDVMAAPVARAQPPDRRCFAELLRPEPDR